MRLFPVSASTLAPSVDHLTIALLLASSFVLAIVAGWIAVSCIVYREGAEANRERPRPRGPSLEWFGIAAILGVFIAIFLAAAGTYFRMHAPPPGSEEITVVAKQWMWKFQHPDGHSELGELHVSVGQPVELMMTSQDVVHSLFVPAFRLKQDVLPGRYTRTWFEATRAGEYPLFCTQYCGFSHSGMRARVVAMHPADYQRWLETRLAKGPRPPRPEELGARLFERVGCINCHGEGSNIHAPKLQGIYGSTVTLTDGIQVLADANYLRESILNPRAKIVQNYEDIMPSFSGLLSEEDVLSLIAYIRSLRSAPPVLHKESAHD